MTGNRYIGQVAVNDESGCDRSMESQSGGGGRELQALVARLLSMLSKKNSSSSTSKSAPSSKSWSRAAVTAMESGGSCTSSTAGRTGFLQASIKQRLCRTRLRRRNSFLAAGGSADLSRRVWTVCVMVIAGTRYEYIYVLYVYICFTALCPKKQ